jgi:hypothetical protein
MAKSTGKGIYLSPGVYRDPKTGKTYQSKTGALPGKKKNLSDSPNNKDPKYKNSKNLTGTENAIVQNQQESDIALGNTFQGQADVVGQTASTPYNYQGPGQAVYNPEERARIEQELMGRFERYDAPRRQQENDDLARWAQSTGNSVDSPAYAARAKQLSDSQNARALDYQSQAVSQGLQEATGQFDMSNQAFQTGVGFYNQTRDRPWLEAGNTKALITGVAPAQEYDFQSRLQQQDFGNQMKLLNASKAGGGGNRPSGGGMTLSPFRPVPNFTGQTQQQPSFWSQAGSSLAGPLAGAFGKKAGEYLASSLFS